MRPVEDGTILVVDDDPVVVKLLTVNFEMEGYEVVAAEDGPTALEKARRYHPDVVVLDVMMPRMDGLEVARRLRADPETEDLPILMLSAKAQAPDVAAGLEIADDYMTKPFEPLELLERVAAVRAQRTGPPA